MNPIWLIVPYASNILILNYVKPNTEPIKVNKLVNNKTILQKWYNK